MVQFPGTSVVFTPAVKSQNEELPQIVSEFHPLVKQHDTWNPSHLKRDTSWNDAFVHYVSLPQCISVKTLVKKTSSNTKPTTTLALLFFNQTTVTWRRSKLLRWCRSFRSQSVKGTKLRAWSSTSAPLFLEWMQNIGLIGAMMNAYRENNGGFFFGKVCFGGDVGWAQISPTVVNHW